MLNHAVQSNGPKFVNFWRLLTLIKLLFQGRWYGVDVRSVRSSHSRWHMCTYYVQAIHSYMTLWSVLVWARTLEQTKQTIAMVRHRDIEIHAHTEETWEQTYLYECMKVPVFSEQFPTSYQQPFCFRTLFNNDFLFLKYVFLCVLKYQPCFFGHQGAFILLLTATI